MIQQNGMAPIKKRSGYVTYVVIFVNYVAQAQLRRGVCPTKIGQTPQRHIGQHSAFYLKKNERHFAK